MNQVRQMVNETAVRVRLCLLRRRSPSLRLVAIAALLLVVLRGLLLPSERLERSVAAPWAASVDVAPRAPASDAAPSAASAATAAALGIPVSPGSDFPLALPSAQELDERGRAHAARPGRDPVTPRIATATQPSLAPRESLEYPFNENMASIQLFEQLPGYEQVRRLRYRTCAVVGSSPEVLLYEDGKEIDRHDAVFRANMVKVNGYQKYSVIGARRESLGGVRQGGDETIVIKNQDPPSIRDPTAEHAKFLAEKARIAAGRGEPRPDYLSRRHIMELYNFLFLQSGVALGDSVLAALDVNLTSIAAKFGASARSNEWKPWHPMGVGIPKFSQVHCSTSTVLLTEALLLCDKVRIYGFHACDCKRACARKRMAARYTSHMRFYHKLRAACDFDFEIARLEHCDYPQTLHGPKLAATR
ncbi:hypothetical protein T492DRAFT_888369 [Pavlovales sp. CCMP2436]|nr:hypothetical protein T492DRAFT_888369 [Pavlovales sp. CCMP2436]